MITYIWSEIISKIRKCKKNSKLVFLRRLFFLLGSLVSPESLCKILDFALHVVCECVCVCAFWLMFSFLLPALSLQRFPAFYRWQKQACSVCLGSVHMLIVGWMGKRTGRWCTKVECNKFFLQTKKVGRSVGRWIARARSRSHAVEKSRLRWFTAQFVGFVCVTKSSFGQMAQL